MKNNDSFIFGGTHPTIYHPFVSAVLPGFINKKVLDIGCGKGIWGYLMRVQRDFSGSSLMGIDLNENYLSFSKKHNIYDKLIKHDITKRLPFKDKSIDVIVCSEVIEHLKKRQGEKLLSEIERIIKPGGRIIITTPNVWLDMPFEGKLDKHYSLWNTNDFKRRGYSVHGIGIKLPFNKTGFVSIIIQSLYFVCTPFSYIFPQVGGFIVAVKDC